MKSKAWLVAGVSGAFLGLGLMQAVGPLMARDLSQLLTGGYNGVQLTNGVPGGLASDGTNFLIVWEGVGQDTNTTSIEGRFITSAGSQEGPRWLISGGGTAQKFPALAWNGEDYLVTWTSQLEGTNLWSIRGCRIGPNGVA